jgi:hypothetical protein
MKKTLIGPILTVIALVLVLGIFVYFYISLNRLEKRTIDIQNTTVTDAGKVSAIVNFLNSKVNAKTTKK